MRRNIRGVVLSLSGLLSALWLASPLLGIENCPKGKTAKSSSSAASSAKSSAAKKDVKKDPVELAFALPHGVVLNAKQQQAYNKLRHDNEGALRSAVQGIQSNNKTVEAKSLKQAKDVRLNIREGMKQILAMPALEAQQKMASEYAARKAAHARERDCPCGRR